MRLLILVVDDEPDVEVLFRQRFQRDLRAGRFTMEFAQSGPTMLQRISDALECGGGGLGKLHGEPASAEVVSKLLSEQNLDIGLIVDHENEHVHARSPDLLKGFTRARQNDPEFGECAGLRIDLYRPAMLLDDDVVTAGSRIT